MADSKAKELSLHFDAGEQNDNLKPMAGSNYQDFNIMVIAQTLNTLRLDSDPEQRHRQGQAMMAAMQGIAPRDELEGMLAAQMVATYNAAMECLRRAMLENQTFEGRREELNQANRLMRTYAGLVETLDKHRGKGRQRITVEHVHVNEGGQAIVGVVNRAAEHSNEAPAEPPSRPAIEHRPEQPMRRVELECEPVPVQEGEFPTEGETGAADATNVIKYQRKRPMRCADPGRETVPAAAGAGEAPVSDAWRRPGERRAAGE